MKRSRSPATDNDGLLMVLQHLPPFPGAVGVVARLRQVNRRLSANGPFWFRVPGRWQFGSNAADQVPVICWLMAHGKTKAMLNALGYRGRVDVLVNVKHLLGRDDRLTNTCLGAAAGGQLHTLQWTLGGDRFLWDDDIAVLAAKYGHCHVLKWLATSGYPMPSRAYEASGRPDVHDCLGQLGYKWPRLEFALVDNMHPSQIGT